MKRLLLVAPLCALTACVPVEPPAPAPQPDPDSCHSAQFQGLVGQPRAVLDQLRLPLGTRVIGPNDPVTMDFRPDRLNFEIGANGLIAKIGCY